MSEVVLVLLTITAVGLVWYMWPRKAQAPPKLSDPGLLEELSLRPQPLLTPTEAAFYNLLQLAAQEQYLVFARVPVSSLVSVQAKDPKDVRTAAFFSRKLARTCVDFALVHPGSLDVVQVIELHGPSDAEHGAATRNGVIHHVLREAGVKLVEVDPHHTDTVPALAALLGIEPRE